LFSSRTKKKKRGKLALVVVRGKGSPPGVFKKRGNKYIGCRGGGGEKVYAPMYPEERGLQS